MVTRQKWELNDGVFFPIPGDTTLHANPGNGVFRVYEQKGLGGSRLGLVRIADKFTFDFKIYDLGTEDIMQKILKTWNSPIFVNGNKNLGVIFNGLKGTGKTIASKILSNRMNLPVVIIPSAMDNLQSFIQSLNFECVVLIDEAEKTFRENADMLLKMIDGVYNDTRKLYILTTNRLSVDENLLGRPGRIRYIKQFGNMTARAVNDYIDDNLEDMKKKDEVFEIVDMLEISTIDILKAIVDEINIHGSISERTMLNIPKASFKVDVIKFNRLPKERFNDVKAFIKEQVSPMKPLGVWLRETWKIDEDDDRLTNENMLERKFDCYCYTNQVASRYSMLLKGQNIRLGEILEDPDQNGFFTVMDSYDDEEVLCCILNYHNAPSLYRGGLQMFGF